MFGSLRTGHRSGGASRGATSASVCVIVSIALSTHGQDMPAGPSTPSAAERVGRLGDPSRISFGGNETYPDQRIRDALLEDPSLLVAGHPRAPLADYLELLRGKVMGGYLRGGFADVAVAVTVDRESERVVVDVVEGPRYTSGDVIVNGAETVPTEVLVQRLTRPSSPADAASAGLALAPGASLGEPGSIRRVDKFGRPIQVEKPVWAGGEPARFDAATKREVTARVRSVLRDLGYFFSTVDVSLAPREQQGTADLVVTLLDEGPPGTVSEITISGNEKNSREDILAYLGLSTGMPVNAELVRRIERRLWESARFLQHTAAVNLSEATNNVVLAIKLTECDMASPLSAELSPEQRILLRSISWLSTEALHETDLVSTIDVFSFCRVELILSRRGALCSLAGMGGLIPDFELAIQPDTTTLYVPSLGRRFVFKSPRMQALASISIVPDLSTGTHLDFLSAVGVQSKRDTSRLPLEVDILVAPVALWWYDPQTQGFDHFMDEERSVLTIAEKQCRLAIRAESGELVELHCEDSEGERRVDATTAEGAFDDALKRLEDVESVSDLSVSDSPPGSFPAFALSELVRSNALVRWGFPDTSLETRERAADTVARIIKRAVTPADASTERGVCSADDRFVIPMDQSPTKSAAMGALYARLATYGFRLVNDLFPERSWPSTGAREIAFMMSGEWRYTGTALKAVYDSPETGPIGCLVLARWLADSNPPLARRFASRGLERLSTRDFRKDYSLCLEGEPALKRMIERAVTALAEAEAEDVEAIAAILPSEMGYLLMTSAAAFRGNRDRPLMQTLAPLLDRSWERTIRAQIEGQLRAIVGDNCRAAKELGREESGAIRIGDETITASQIWRDMPVGIEAKAKSLSSWQLTRLIRQTATQLIQQRVSESLLFQEAVWTPTSFGGGNLNALVDSRIETVVSEEYGGSQEDFERYLAGQGLTLDGLRRKAQRILIVSSYLEKVVKPALEAPSEQELDAMVELQRASWSKPERRRMSLIEVPVVVPGGTDGSTPTAQQITKARAAARTKAERARRELEAGAGFSDVARRYSSGHHAEDGGSWGWVSRGAARERFEKAVETLYAIDPGTISEVVDTPNSYFIVRCDERDSAHEPDLRSVKARLREQLLRQRHEQRIAELVAQLRAQASIDPAELAVLHQAVVDRTLANVPR